MTIDRDRLESNLVSRIEIENDCCAVSLTPQSLIITITGGRARSSLTILGLLLYKMVTLLFGKAALAYRKKIKKSPALHSTGVATLSLRAGPGSTSNGTIAALYSIH